MSYTVKAVNDEGGLTLARHIESIEIAREIGAKAFENGDIDADDIVQIWSDDEDVTAVEEFGFDEI